MKKSPLYTRTGDHGQTSLVGGQRVSKCCTRLESYGTIDELNSHIGLLVSYIRNSERFSSIPSPSGILNSILPQTSENETVSADSLAQVLTDIQSCLFVLGSYLATDTSNTELRQYSVVTPEMVAALEHQIDLLDSLVPPFRAFILPGGTQAASQAHVCRTVCRRAERCMIALQEEIGEELDTNVMCYINRLSDYLFVLARYLNIAANHEEILWEKKKK